MVYCLRCRVCGAWVDEFCPEWPGDDNREKAICKPCLPEVDEDDEQ